MKLMRVGLSGRERPALLASDGTLRDLAGIVPDIAGEVWVKGKSCDTFGPLGPWLVAREEIVDPQKLALWLEVNGHRYQSGSTRTMIFAVAYLVSHISRYMTLMPSDTISTGTLPGVGMGQNPQVFLRAGDVVELGIEGLGRQRQRGVGAS